MGKVTGEKDDGVLDLSLKKSDVTAYSTVYSVLYNANDVRTSSSSSSSSSSNTPSSSAAVTVASSPVSRQHSQENSMRTSLAQLDTRVNTNSSDEVTCTSVTSPASVAVEALCRSSVATITSAFQLYSNKTYSCHLHTTATATTVGYQSSLDLSVSSSSCTTPYTVMSTFTGSDGTSLVRSALKRARRQSGEASGTVELPADGSTDTLQHRLSATSSEPVGLQSSDDTDDATYVERRRKNNESAKRSRDARRLKEKLTALRAAELEQENVQLRAELAVLRNQAAKLHCLIYNKLGI